MYYVYILQDASGKNYVGYSHNLKRRLSDHHGKWVTTTHTYHNVELAWYCAFKTKDKALAFEQYLKKGSGHAFMKKHLL